MMTATGMPLAISFAGFMGSGKSTIGHAVAEQLGWTFVDLDAEIERAAGMGISETFDLHGESAFRRQEHDALRAQAGRAVAGTRLVLALGGGTYAFDRNRTLLRSIGPTIWLDADAATLWNRVHHSSHRPLARDRDRFERLHEDRRESYALADFRIDGSDAPTQVTNRILSLGWVKDLQRDA